MTSIYIYAKFEIEVIEEKNMTQNQEIGWSKGIKKPTTPEDCEVWEYHNATGCCLWTKKRFGLKPKDPKNPTTTWEYEITP